jgi:hypothetical protein
MLALLATGGIVAYSVAAGSRLPEVVAGVGAAGVLLVALALAGRWPSLLPLGLVGVAAAYALYLSLRTDSVDPWAPLVAAALFVAAELAYWSMERQEGPGDRAVLARRITFLGIGALGTAILGGALLIVAGGDSGGVALEAAGIVAAVVLLAVIAFLAARPGSTEPDRRGGLG